jgi:hypothetical protein
MNFSLLDPNLLHSSLTSWLPFSSLESAPNGRLAGKEKRLRIFAFATELERTEILVPSSFWNIRPGFHPETELVQILEIDITLVHALDPVVANSGRKPGPGLDLRHSFTRITHRHLFAEDEASHLIAQLFYFVRIGRCPEAFRQREESLLFLLLRF